MNRTSAIAISCVSFCSLAVAAGPSWGQSTTRPRARKVTLKLVLPKAMFKGTPVPMNEPNIAKGRAKGQARPVIKAPYGSVNLALKRPVTSSETLPVTGDLEMVTDGDKSGEDGHNVDIGFGKKWVQIDLGTASRLSVIALWHYHGQARAYRDVIVEVADDADFTQNVKIIFSNDHDNSAGLGAGKDKGYIDCVYGRTIECIGTVGRYVRLYTKGNNTDAKNHYVEVEVYGRTLKGMSLTTKPAKTKTPTRSKGQ